MLIERIKANEFEAFAHDVHWFVQLFGTERNSVSTDLKKTHFLIDCKKKRGWMNIQNICQGQGCATRFISIFSPWPQLLVLWKILPCLWCPRSLPLPLPQAWRNPHFRGCSPLQSLWWECKECCAPPSQLSCQPRWPSENDMPHLSKVNSNMKGLTRSGH